jgi:hypothetical protein
MLLAKGTMQAEAARLGLTATHECHRVKRRKEEGEQLIENPLANFVSETKGSARQSQPAQQPGANGKAERPGYAKVCTVCRDFLIQAAACRLPH